MASKLIDSLFFLRKQKSTVEKNFEDFKKYFPEIKRIMRQPDQNFVGEDMIKEMYDFYENYETRFNNFEQLGPGDMMPAQIETTIPHQADPRKVALPKDVVDELERIPTPFTLESLDEKIKLMKDKSYLSTQRFVKEQIDGMLQRLENRKKYKEHFDFYNSFPNTNDEKIDVLLSKYKLVMHKSDLYVPVFPKEAIDVMKEYSKITRKISGEAPVFYVIADEKDFKKKHEKLDPILLVQSPFGFYWQILGAWDKEMLLLSEL